MDIKVISKVAISVTQADLEGLVRDKIAAHDDKIHVNSIEFIQRRNPNRIDVEVDAQYGKPEVAEAAPVEEATEEESSDFLTDANMHEEEETSASETETEKVSGIFA